MIGMYNICIYVIADSALVLDKTEMSHKIVKYLNLLNYFFGNLTGQTNSAYNRTEFVFVSGKPKGGLLLYHLLCKIVRFHYTMHGNIHNGRTHYRGESEFANV